MTQGLQGAPTGTCIGLAQGALEDATEYALQRKQFGMPIAEYQAIRFKIATMAQRSRPRVTFSILCVANSTAGGDTEAAMVKLLPPRWPNASLRRHHASSAPTYCAEPD